MTNRRGFPAGALAAAVAAPVPARPADPWSGGGPRELMTRTRRLPDLAGQPGADAYEAYIGERFDIVAGPGTGQQLVVEAVERVSRRQAAEQFNVAFGPALPGGPLAEVDGVRLLRHATGQRVALRLERRQDGYVARFNVRP